MKIPKHLRPAARRAKAEGWSIEVAGNGHLKWSPPDGPAVFTGSTPKRRGHGPLNARRDLAKAGLGAKG